MKNKLALYGGKPLRNKKFPQRFLYNYKEKEVLNKIINYSIKSGISFRYYEKYNLLYEKKFIKFMQGGYCCMVNSGTNALLCILNSLNIKKGSEIIVPVITDVGSVTPILLSGYKPVPADISEKTLNTSVEQIKKKINKKTSAIIVPHIGGEAVNLLNFSNELKKKKIFLIEDCSQSHGARINEKKIGKFGDVSFFSTMASKLHTTGGTGAVIYAKNKRIINRVRQFSDRGKVYKNNKFTGSYNCIGINSTLDELSAGIGTVQIEKLKKTIKKTNYIGEYIKKHLKENNSPSQILGQEKKSFNVYWFIRINLNLNLIKCNKKTYCNALSAEGLPVEASYKYNPFEKKWFNNFIKKNNLSYKKDDILPTNYKKSLREQYLIYIRENFSKQDVLDIINIIKKVDNYFTKKKNLKLERIKSHFISKKWVKWLNDKEVTKFSNQKKYKHNLKTQKQFLTKKLNDKKKVILFKIMHLNIFIGIFEINLKKNIAEIRYMIGEKKLWNQGLGSNSIDTAIEYIKKECKNIKEVFATTNFNNIASQNILQKNNFKLIKKNMKKNFFLRKLY